ncbi:MAG TPA: hypothetical protein VEO54_26735 [Thermoanaerobaculia bacterium]|nr:hypothetical protein [Thermoanaerobaculia bacterium]
MTTTVPNVGRGFSPPPGRGGGAPEPRAPRAPDGLKPVLRFHVHRDGEVLP